MHLKSLVPPRLSPRQASAGPRAFRQRPWIPAFAGMMTLFADAADSLQPAALVDASTFLLSHAGKPAAKEDFTISRTTTSSRGYTWTSTRHAGGADRMQSSLQTDSLGVPFEYRSRGKPDEGVFRLITARRTDRRLTVRGIRAEEPVTLTLGQGTLLLDEGSICSFYFVGLATVPGVISYVSLQRYGVMRESVTRLGVERLVIGRDTVEAQHFGTRCRGSDAARDLDRLAETPPESLGSADTDDRNQRQATRIARFADCIMIGQASFVSRGGAGRAEKTVRASCDHGQGGERCP